ncbi:MAG TPA: esterase-like activity of phytase family protein [Phenylobacterium sp.]|nr:esterase-like activity of phytase family protein [Phenylobacterium sp.]
MRRWAGFALAAALLAACAPRPSAALPVPIRVDAEPVAEWPEGEKPAPPDNFTYAGGLVLTSKDTARLHGLSDLVVLPDGRMISQSDEGDLVRARITLDAQGRLTGVAEATFARLTGQDGQPLPTGKSESDAEGLALWPNGDLMVSFERRHRIWLYPADGGSPREVPHPDAPFPNNEGMEALALDPADGPDAYRVGREDTRETWVCHLAGGCATSFSVAGVGEGWLTSARAMPPVVLPGGWVFLLRDYNPLTQATTIRIRITDAQGRTVDTHVIAAPAAVDNFEGIAVLPNPNGSARLYLISDDNFSARQRTLLLAFDWRPKPGATP